MRNEDTARDDIRRVTAAVTTLLAEYGGSGELTAEIARREALELLKPHAGSSFEEVIAQYELTVAGLLNLVCGALSLAGAVQPYCSRDELLQKIALQFEERWS